MSAWIFEKYMDFILFFKEERVSLPMSLMRLVYYEFRESTPFSGKLVYRPAKILWPEESKKAATNFLTKE